MKKPILEVTNLVAEYGENRVLDGINYDVRPGEILVILGKSGCGKSTLLKNTTRLIDPVSGSLRYWGKDIMGMDEDELSRVMQNLGISFQGGALFNSMTVFNNVALSLREYTGLDEDTIRAIVMIKLSMVVLADAAQMMPSELSGGMKKRAGVARALALDPKLLFFDEPSAGLDPVSAADLDQLILSLRRILDMTMVVVTHELASIHTIADRVLMLHNKKAAFFGTIKEANQSQNPVVREFFDRKTGE